MVGVGYEEGPDGFRSCLHSRAELSRERTGEVVWSQDFEPAEDLSPRPRRDYFASYRLRLPEGLEPGRYRLTLEQTDALTGLSGRKAIELVVRP